MPISIHWIPLSSELPYHHDVVNIARTLGCTAVELSHHICHNADDLLDDADKAARANAIADLYRAQGMEVWAWTHEFHRPPQQYVRNGTLNVDEHGLWSYLETKYDRFFNQTLSGLTGIILTFAETDFSVYKDQIIASSQSIQQRMARLINTMNAICKRHGKVLAIRDFVYRLAEIHELQAVIDTLDDDIVVMSKTVPHDWHPYYPHNPVIGQTGGNLQWVEHDFGHEYEGQHLYPYANLTTILHRLRYEHSHGVRTHCLRLDRPSPLNRQSAIYRPWGLLELQAVRDFQADPTVTEDQIWQRWGKDYFPAARELVETATQAVCHFLYVQKCWLANHCRLPEYAYAVTHVTGGKADRLPVWTADAADIAAEHNFKHMTPAWLNAILSEADEGAALARRCQEILDRRYIEDGWRGVWFASVANLNAWAEVFGQYKRAYFSLELLRQSPGAIARDEVARRIDSLEQTCRQVAPALAGNRLERVSAPDDFPNAIASLRHVLATLA